MGKFGGPQPGSGRPKGKQNAMTLEIKKAIMAAFDGVGGVEYLEKLAYKEPRAFVTLLSKCVPTEIAGKLQVEDVTSRQTWLQKMKAELNGKTDV